MGTRPQSFGQLPRDFSVFPRLDVVGCSEVLEIGEPLPYVVPDKLLKGKTSLKISHLAAC